MEQEESDSSLQQKLQVVLTFQQMIRNTKTASIMEVLLLFVRIIERGLGLMQWKRGMKKAWFIIANQ